MPYRILLILCSLLVLTTPALHADDKARLVVAWVEDGDLYSWRSESNTQTKYAGVNALFPYISPDGQYVAYSTAAPASLWLIALSDPIPVEIVPNAALSPTDAQFLHIGNLQWASNNHLYFNTYIQPSRIILQSNDLWLVDATARTYKQLLPSPQAGSFTLSPDGNHITIVQPGAYNTTDGTITFVDSNGQNRLTPLNFPAVSTASDYDFIPPLFWENDSKAVNIAIPEKDLVYHDDTAPVTLWHLAVDGTKTQRGTLQTSFFGLPQWSDDGAHLAYLRHKGDITTNEFEMMIALGDGTNPVVYASGTAGGIGVPHWLPNSNQFIYPQGTSGDYWIGQPDQPPQLLPNAVFYPRFVDSSTYVYATATGDTFELRYARLGASTSTLIASVHNAIPIFDARQIP
jgi:Tol biopolymer transport system component